MYVRGPLPCRIATRLPILQLTIILAAAAYASPGSVRAQGSYPMIRQVKPEVITITPPAVEQKPPTATLGEPVFRDGSTAVVPASASPTLLLPNVIQTQAIQPVQPFVPPPPKKAESPFLERVIEPELSINLTVGLPRLLVLKETPKKIQLGGDEKNEIATITVISERELSIIGKTTGRTVLNLWFPDAAKPGQLKIASFLLLINPDLDKLRAQQEAQARSQEAQYVWLKKLEAQINQNFPDSKICLNLVAGTGGSVIVSGQARDIQEATLILQILGGRRRGGNTGNANNKQVTVVQQGLVQSKIEQFNPDDRDTLARDDGTMYGGLLGPLGNIQVINMLRVPGEQQVGLKVTIAEVNRTALRSLGVNFSVTNNAGITVIKNTTGDVAANANIPLLLDNGQVAIAIRALKDRALAKLLAEPNLVALNGQTANFNVGGSFPVPVVTGFTASGLQGVQFVPFGVQLAFRPTITDKDRIRLSLASTVSSRNNAGGATVNGTNVPGLDSRDFETTVEMRQGQTFAIAGLLQTKYGADSKKWPFIGELPLIGNLTGVQNTAASELELVVLVSPYLVHPVGPNQWRPMPGSDIFEPSDAEFYLHGRLESHRPVDYRSPARTDGQRTLEYHRSMSQTPYQPVPSPK